MSGEEKAALLLNALPAEMAATVLNRLAPERRDRLRARMQSLSQGPEAEEALLQALRQFEDLLGTEGRDTVELSTQAPESEPSPTGQPAGTANVQPPARPEAAPPTSSEAQPKPARITEPVAAANSLEELAQLSADQLAGALQGEHPRTVALVLDYLPPAQSGEVLKRFSPELRREASLQLSQATGPANLELLQRIAQAIIHKSRTLSTNVSRPTAESKFKKMADMLRVLGKTERNELLTTLAEHNAKAADQVKEFLYQFEDLLLIEDRSLQKLLAEIDAKNLAIALKAAPETIKEKVMNNLSKRARDSLAEETEFLGNVPASQIEQAQKIVVELIQRLDQAGELVMNQ
jgi:flagellar motor switch protein FliG